MSLKFTQKELSRIALEDEQDRDNPNSKMKINHGLALSEPIHDEYTKEYDEAHIVRTEKPVSKRDRHIIELRDKQGLKFTEIAEIVGMTPNSVQVIYHKAKRNGVSRCQINET
jgi:DNA-directed RNA polymerase specialized sigma24 family protein